MFISIIIPLLLLLLWLFCSASNAYGLSAKNPLAWSYSSMVPYLFGDGLAVKFKVLYCTPFFFFFWFSVQVVRCGCFLLFVVCGGCLFVVAVVACCWWLWLFVVVVCCCCLLLLFVLRFFLFVVCDCGCL